MKKFPRNHYILQRGKTEKCLLWKKIMGSSESKPVPPLAEVIAADSVVMFTRSCCPYCIKARRLLDSKNVEYREIDIFSSEGDQLFDEVMRTYKHETVPAIFINQTFVGGCDSLVAADSSGKLAELLAKK